MSTAWISFFFFQAEDGIRDRNVTGVQTCALPILIEPHIANTKPGRREIGMYGQCRSPLPLGVFDPPLIAIYLRQDRKSTRLNSSHVSISYAVFCLKKKKKTQKRHSAPSSSDVALT